MSLKRAEPSYEFGGPVGAFFVSFGLPVLVYASTFLCNDLSGCPVPSLLSPSTTTIDRLKQEVGWPSNGFKGLASWDVSGKVLCYYLLNAVLHCLMPGEEVEGVKLACGGKHKYKLNTWSSTIFILTLLAAGTAYQGASFPVWTFIYDNYLHILTANVIISYALATFVYIRSFGVKPGNSEFREIAVGGRTGNMLYDWFIGRELNPRVSLPLLGEIDIKLWCELRPGLLGWMLLDFAFVVHQYKAYGFITDSIVLLTAFQVLYILDAWWMESSVLTTMDITTDGFGFMLSFGDLVWVPFVYSLQARYLAVYPVSLGILSSSGVLGVVAVGYYIFRSANNEKNRFRTNPKDPRVQGLKYLTTKAGSKLLITGWWGIARHINYFGDWIMAWAYCLPTGIAGYIIRPVTLQNVTELVNSESSFFFHKSATQIVEVTQGPAKGYGMFFTYFYLLYFTVLLIHREIRDEEKCERKYGDDWERYREIVCYRIIPGVY
ncbi:Delta(14)-sterol reductase [Erysiphe pulchra]|uniref:Delta(14)-sterol reductase n=1 Tax=Erysiphe pulchra TaxID=225359 RepID=A0A2S4PTZ9_9PEZI|nr:Delta(14)-sterol reductase [Erysiphe pulchra]